MSTTVRILVALVVGLGAGTAASAAGMSSLTTILAVAATVGGLWVDALRMTIVPLVFSLVVTGITSATATAAAGGSTVRALILFGILLIASAAFGAVMTPTLLALLPIPPGAIEAFKLAASHAAPAASAVPPATDWLRTIIPANPIGAAADGAVLSVVIFALVFGFALTRIEPESQERVAGFFQVVARTMLVIVQWVLLVAPLGVFALAFVVGSKAGLSAAGGLVHYVILISILCLTLTVALYPAVAWFSRVPVRDFARAAAPAQLVAISTQSSLASLPAMVEGAHKHMRVSRTSTDLVLPLAVSLFRFTSPAANLGVALYLAELYGVQVTLGGLVAGAATAAVVSVASVGLPSQASFFSVVAPVCMVLGLPIEILGLLLAVESIPDIFRTLGNVTADVAVAGASSSSSDDSAYNQSSRE